MADNKHRFWPIRGKEEQVLAQPIVDGKLLFTTDTNKIYLDANGGRYLMGGGNSGIVYADGTETDITKASADETDTEYYIALTALENSAVIPKEDDLILNSDGRFFRVLSYDASNQRIVALLLAVSGSGGGGSDTSYKRRFTIDLEKPNPSTLINGQNFRIYFTVKSAIDNNDYVLDNDFVAYITLAEKVSGTTDSFITYYSSQTDVQNDIRTYFDITEFLRESTTTRITIYAKGIENGTSKEYSTDVTTAVLSLSNSATFSNLSVFPSSGVNLSCEAVGSMNKILNFYFDGEVVESRHLTANSSNTQTYQIDPSLASQGVHSVKIELSQARINVLTEEWEPIATLDPLEFEVAVYDSSSDYLLPIIWLGNYQSDYYNYDSIQIPFMVYNPASPASATVNLKKNGQDIAGSPRTISTEGSGGNRSWNIFEIADADIDVLNYYSISCGSTERTITFTVTQDPNRTMEIVRKADLALSFDATGRSNSESESNRALISDSNTKALIPSVFTDFNWYNNGWVLDNNKKTCLRISNGASLRLPIGTMTLNNQNLVNEQSVTFELEFKVRNVQSYENLVSNTTRYVGDEEYYLKFLAQEKYKNYDSFLHDYLPTIGEEYDDLVFNRVQKDIDASRVVAKYYSGSGGNLTGFGIGPQDAFFSNGTDIVNISFVEDKIVNLSMIFSYPDQRLYIYNNGIITGVISNSVTNPFIINSSELVFNSTYCDIDLYKFRIYKTALNVNEIVQNYAIDKKNIDIYDQNKLARDNTALNEYQFSYESMLKYNEDHPNAPLMPYVIYDTSNKDIDKLSYRKSKKNPIDFEFVNTQLELAYRNGELLTLAIADGLCTANSSAEEKAAAIKEYYLHHCPSFIAVNSEMAVQGTSSEFYPRRNYKIKTKTKFDADKKERTHIYLNRGPFLNDFLEDQTLTKNFTSFIDPTTGKNYKLKSAQDFFYMDNYTVGTTKFTMKIDYMESSGTYNTGFANLVANAYSKHPLADYNAAGAFAQTDGYELATGAFNAKETYYVDDAGTKPEVKPTAETYAPGTYYVAKYKNYTFDNLSDYRTSVQGFRVLAFHKKKEAGSSGSQYEFIGMYNMNIDKGSDEIYGFKPDKSIVNNFLKKKAVRKMAECWEFENNARTFCSFRDPWNRYELSFKGPDNEWFNVGNRKDLYPAVLNGDEAPIVVDSFEYRYNTNDDFIDNLIKTSTAVSSPEISAAIQEEFGVNIANNVEIAGDLILDLYKNWERAVKWVWSTSTKDIAALGTYELDEEIGNEWLPNTFYILDEENSYQPIYDEHGEDTGERTGPVYILDTADHYQSGVIYRKKITNADGNDEYVNAFVGGTAYKKNTFYIMNSDGTYTLSNDDFDESVSYYRLIQLSDEILAQKAARLVEKDSDGVFDPEAEYYTYDGSVIVSDIITGEANPTVKVNLDSESYVPDTYYKGITVRYNNIDHKYDTQEYRSEKFFNEISKHFDTEYMATYLIMTEVFECYDSRGKNVMMASWGPLEEGGDYIWYPIFYDIDTQLGINNTGIPSFTYNVDATIDGNYSTSDSVLWNNYYNQFRKSYVLQKYRHLKGVTTGVPSSWGVLRNPPLQSIDFIESWYETNPNVCNSIAMRGARPMIATNLDAWYKYLTITNSRGLVNGETGYMDANGNYTPDSSGTYFYALQGDRSQSRQQFLSNRIEYIDSWLNEGNYQRGGANRIRGRVAANNPARTSDKWTTTQSWNENSKTWVNDPSPYFDNLGNKTHEFDAEYWINLTPVRSSYVTLSDDNEAYPSQKYDGINPVKFNIDAIENGVKNSANYPEQLLYIYGMNQMADLGEMHNLYWQEFELSGDARKLTTLNLGYDGEDANHNKWYNRNMNLPTIPGKKPTSEIEYGLPLLQEVNLSNITINTGSPTLDLTSCEKLKNLRATGSNYENFTFAEGVALDTLYLPSSITQLKLTEANLLNNLLTTYTTPTRNASGKLEAQRGLFIEGLFDETTPTTKINTISLIGGNLGYDSYKLLKQWYNIKDALFDSGNDIGVNALTLTKVKWSPYIQLVDGDSYDSTHPELYYIDNGHYGLTSYTYNSDTFRAQVLNGEIYKKDSKISNDIINQISDVSMLEDFISSTHYKSTGAQNVPNITGIIYVNNIAAIDELYIKDTLVKNYPQLTFFFNAVTPCYSAKFVLPNDDGSYSYVSFQDENILEPTVQKISSDQWFKNPYSLYSPTKKNYDFHGWSTTLDNSGLISEEDWDSSKANIFDPDIHDYVFYAIFTIHEYQMEYYLNGVQLSYTQQIPFGQPLVTPAIIPAYSDNSLTTTEVYQFLGWTLSDRVFIVDKASQANLVDFSKMLSVQDYRFYAVFKKQSVYDSVTGGGNFEKYFDFTLERTVQNNGVSYCYSETGNLSDDGSAIWEGARDAQYNIQGNGYKIDIKENIALSGKVTLPTYYKGLPIVKLGKSFTKRFSNGRANNITHIFWKRKENEPCMLRVLENSQNTTSSDPDMHLEYFEMPDGVRVIGGFFFRGFASIKTITPYENDGSVVENTIQLPESLTFIGQSSFNYAFISNGIIDRIYLPGTLTSIQRNAFINIYCTINLLEIGSEQNRSNLKYIINADIQDINSTDNGGAPVYSHQGGSTNRISIYFKTNTQNIRFYKIITDGYISFNGGNIDWHNI